MPLIAGIDCGSGYTKAVIVNARGEGEPVVAAKAAVRTGVELEKAAKLALGHAIAGLNGPSDEVSYVATTGFGRSTVSFRDIQITEITSAARGASFLVPGTECVLDIGSQSTRAILLRDGSRVKTFKTNDKCAAGSGTFILRAAKYLEIGIDDVGPLSARANNPQPISSVCAVLAESEIINHVSAGVALEDILRGVHDSLADRAAAMLKRVGMGRQVTIVGGVARQQGMVLALRERLRVQVDVAPDCEYACAVGAALLGYRRFLTKLASQSTAELVGSAE
jgi:predicted CoA-substrate-specific enzyme activase